MPDDEGYCWTCGGDWDDCKHDDYRGEVGDGPTTTNDPARLGSLWRRTLPKRLLGVLPYVHVCNASEVNRTFYGLTPIQAWDRAGAWLAKQERTDSTP